MAKVSYTIEVTLARRKTDQLHSERIEKERCVHIHPCGEDQLPLLIEANGPHYRLIEEKTIRQCLFNEIGQLRMETYQPCYIHVGSRNVKDVPRHRFMTVTLRFKPSKAQFQLPRLEKLNIKLNATTFYGAKPLKHVPAVQPFPNDLSQRRFSKRLFLAAHSLQNIQ
ncbi:hypothetical protein B0J12DRAFT_753965 [Macrophomina phaseolina]|uniref:Uncharacterized protein n=1 Tax=Macrophomina phaseolina TaxID=35725 RepID=A0ABQ8FPG0_9PEZI|nr:hypothetical protein B0J12DRAFT_753965 [Macrophomina phaseolina]